MWHEPARSRFNQSFPNMTDSIFTVWSNSFLSPQALVNLSHAAGPQLPQIRRICSSTRWVETCSIAAWIFPFVAPGSS